LAVFAANGVSEFARKLFQLDGRRERPREKHEWSLRKIGFVVMVLLFAVVLIVGRLSSQHSPG